ncbi:hypothetical protein BGZ73_006423 [Actinomortierella ambigua]|nr:hypothetical protein BGZ73_006423 [Actinomortierella ambigua]
MVCTIHNNQLIAWGGSYGNKAPETIVNGTPIIFNLNTNSWVTSFTASAINTEPGSDHDVNKDLPKPPSYNPGGESKVPLGAIIGGAAGGVLLLALLAFLFYRRSRRRASDDQNKTSNKKQKNKEYSDDHTDSEAVMSTNSFYDGELGVNPLGATTAPIASSHRPPNQHSYQYYYTPPEYDSFTPESEPPPRPPPAPPLDNGSVGSGTQRPYTPPVSDQSAYEHYYNAAGIATAAAAASSFHPRSGLDGSNLMHLYEPSDNTASTATTPLTKLSTVTSASAGTGAASIPSASPTSSFGTPRSTQPLLEATSPRINRATRPAVSSPQTGLDRMLMAHTSQETDGSGATFFQPGSGVGGGRVYTAGAGAGAGATQVDDTYRPQSMVSNSSTNTSRTGSAPQYVPPGPSRHSQWFGSPQDYDGGRTPTVYSSRASRGSEPSPTTTASVVLGGPGSQQSKVWGNHHQHHQNHYQSHVEGSQQGRGDGGTGLRGGTVAPRSLRFKNPQEGVSEESATEYVPPPPVRPRNWG